MKYALVTALLALLLLDSSPAAAAISDARATPRQLTLFGTSGNLVQVRWQVATTPDHATGVSSPAATIVDPGTGRVLLVVNTSLDAAGSGPFVLRESLQVDADTVRGWQAAGLERVVLERSFGDPATGGGAVGRVVLRLSGSQLRALREGAPSELLVVSVRLEFETGNNTAIVERDADLRAGLTVQHTGTGILRGRWQIAEPGSSEAVPVFRTLALVNTQVRAGQRSYLRSPVLPTSRPGVYLLRFCVSGTDPVAVAEDAQCPGAGQVVHATYQVHARAGFRVVRIRSLEPDRARLGQEGMFRWGEVPGAATYQVQIFEFAPRATTGGEAPEPRFIAGMLVPGDAGATRLTELARSRLSPERRYLWRVTAYDQAGVTIGTSEEASFIFSPDG
ncbi:hypothetical protein [Thioalkalivibrio sp. XN8]|uniref:hypothetical protein n=1 Tax=Thioalkalivibrio sp. XN8 TaxID=2712863 RepID=UPI0013EC9FAD|nr:hypothetical protein [Thioalkalivibrio sp. XN8]NGP53478.1 hypothetical protein [Thioalkalivibrio sp. XN8]